MSAAGSTALRRALRVAGALLLALLLAALAALLWYRQASLPTVQGEIAVRGLGSAVKIVRDAHAVPTITAASEADALFGLGFVHAQERLWQMDFNRRVAQGRLAELVGAGGLDIDRMTRTLGLSAAAARLLESMDAETRRLLDAYVAGVNAALDTRSGPLPPEFLLTGAPAPAPWTAADSMGWAMLMALDLGQDWRDELARLRLAARFSLDEINDLRPPPGSAAVVPTADYPALYRLMGLFDPAATPGSAPPPAGPASTPPLPAPRAALLDDADRLAALPPLGGLGLGDSLGSNAWVVAARRSAAGKPLLANDPHLALTAPSVWFLAQLDAPGLKVSGATLPGLPWVMLGRNAQVAWGATSFHGDGADLYIERLHPTDPSHYQTPAGWARFDERSEVIKVRGGNDVTLTARSTRHGPVLSGVAGIDERLLPARRHVLALRWAVLAPGDTTLAALRALNHARSGADVQRALEGWTLTQQWFVFADVAGQIGMQAGGRFPRRAAAHDLQGVAPAPGWDARYDWDGVVAGSALPRTIDPPEGWLMSANHDTVPAGYLPRLGHDYALPFRAQRIAQLLAARDRHDLTSMRAIQTDIRSLAAPALVAALTRALGAEQPQTEAGRVMLARLRQWDGAMAPAAPEPLLFHALQRQLREAVFGDDLGNLAATSAVRAEPTQALINVLGGGRARDWCDRRDTARLETCAQLVAEAIDDTAAELVRSSGRDVLGLRWADAHVARLEHRPLSQVTAVRSLFEHRLAVGGDAHSPAVAAPSQRLPAPFTAIHGAGVRLLFDLGGDGAWVLSTGQSGHPLSDHYGDHAELWQRARDLPQRAAAASAAPALTLKPAAR
jgi:penicillin amidase